MNRKKLIYCVLLDPIELWLILLIIRQNPPFYQMLPMFEISSQSTNAWSYIAYQSMDMGPVHRARENRHELYSYVM